MNKHQREKQRVSFTYGNVKLSNPRISLKMVEDVDRELKEQIRISERNKFIAYSILAWGFIVAVIIYIVGG